MKKVLLIVSAIILLTGSFISCKKGSSGGGTVISGNAAILTQQPWKITKFEQKAHANDPYVDYFPGEASCIQDDEYVFAVNNVYQLIEGATKCNPSDPDIIFTGFWQFTQNETHLKLDNTEYGKLQLDNTTMILADTSYLVPDSTYTRITLGH